MSITMHLNEIKSAVYGRDVRDAIHDAIKECYDDAAINNNNANMEVTLARGTHDTLNERLTEHEQKMNEVETEVLTLKTHHVNVREFGAIGDGIADDTKAIIDAISYSEVSNIRNVFLPTGMYKITGKITIPWGVNLIGICNRSTFQVEFSDDYAIELKGRHLLENICFYYPDNNATTTTTPKPFPASIFSENLGYSTIRNVNLGNAYVGIYLKIINGGSLIENIYGYPLYTGIEIGHCIDVTPISRVHFNPNFYGTPNLGLRKFVFENAIGIKIGRLDFGNVDRAFAWGYKALFRLVASTSGGSPNNIKFTNWIADACQQLCVFDNHDGGISFTNGTGVFYNPFKKEEEENGITPTTLSNYVVHVKGGGDGVWGGKLVSFINNRIYRCENHFMKASNPIIFIGNEVSRYANSYSEADSAVIDCIQLAEGADGSIISNNSIDGKNLAKNRCISIVGSSNNLVIGNNLKGYKLLDIYSNTEDNTIILNSSNTTISAKNGFSLKNKQIMTLFPDWDSTKLYLNLSSNSGVEAITYAGGVRVGGNLEVREGSIIPTSSAQDLGDSDHRWRNGIFNGVVRTGLGSSSNRPTNVEAASFWFDSNLGKPIWWTGSSWVDANGNKV